MAVRKRGVFLTCLLTLCLLLGTTSCLYPEENDSAVDSDGDGWTNAQEKIAGTDSKNVDTDDDGYWDPHDPNPLSLPVIRNERCGNNISIYLLTRIFNMKNVLSQ